MCKDHFMTRQSTFGTANKICVWCEKGKKVKPIYNGSLHKNILQVEDDNNPQSESGRCLECWKEIYPKVEYEKKEA